MGSKPIVVGVDGSDESKRALRWAAEYGKQTGAPLEALVAWEPPTNYGWPTYYDDVDFAKQARERLEQTVREVLGDMPVRLRVEHQHPAAALVEASRDASALAVGKRGHGEFKDVLLGSVSQHCVHHAHCPVIVIRGD